MTDKKAVFMNAYIQFIRLIFTCTGFKMNALNLSTICELLVIFVSVCSLRISLLLFSMKTIATDKTLFTWIKTHRDFETASKCILLSVMGHYGWYTYAATQQIPRQCPHKHNCPSLNAIRYWKANRPVESFRVCNISILWCVCVCFLFHDFHCRWISANDFIIVVAVAFNIKDFSIRVYEGERESELPENRLPSAAAYSHSHTVCALYCCFCYFIFVVCSASFKVAPMRRCVCCARINVCSFLSSLCIRHRCRLNV